MNVGCRHLLRAALLTLGAGLVVWFIWLGNASSIPFLGGPWKTFHASLTDDLGIPRFARPETRAMLSAFLLVGLAWGAGLPPHWLRIRGIPRAAWRVTLCSFAVALPVLAMLGWKPEIQDYYRNLFEDRGLLRTGVFAANILIEQCFVQGWLLGTILGASWKVPEALWDPPVGRLASLGFGRRAGIGGLLGWLGIPPAAFPALLGSALVFALGHVGKDPLELASALPGGFVVAWLTWRCGSVWPGILLHWATGLVVIGVMALAR